MITRQGIMRVLLVGLLVWIRWRRRSVIGTHTLAETKNAGKIDSYGGGVSVGISVKKIFGGLLDRFSIGVQETMTKGFKTNSYKKEDDREKRKQ